ncbi:dUTP diphosphatase [Oceanobacillus sp. FSL W7-1309]|uniref:dUTP diphosphatase n=1 Tax=Oceanobacillus sp. FSL W7-1309 TaxID=2954539 RepID=UPI0030F84F87
MNLSKLFEIQAGLDYHIVKEKGLEGQDLLDMKMLSLQVELGECANEWRGFKFWSKDQEPRTKVGLTSYYAAQQGLTRNPLLEEYVDCLHFILSIGLSLNINSEDICVDGDYTELETTNTFNKMFKSISEVHDYINYGARDDLVEAYDIMFSMFVGLGELQLGFTWEQIEQAYLDKNKINHDRQLNGY